jgi:hypothetical protein
MKEDVTPEVGTGLKKVLRAIFGTRARLAARPADEVIE